MPCLAGEVGRVGVAIDSLADMERVFTGIPLDRVSVSMTINAGGRSRACSASTLVEQLTDRIECEAATLIETIGGPTAMPRRSRPRSQRSIRPPSRART